MLILSLLLWPFILVGLFVIYSIVRTQQPPADESNRINKIILIWFALTREDKFTDLLPFLEKDLWQNLGDTK